MKLLHLQQRKNDGHLFVVKFPDWGEVCFKLPNLVRSRQYGIALSLANTPEDLHNFRECVFRECVVQEEITFDQRIPAGIVVSVVDLIVHLAGLDPDVRHYTENLFHNFREQVDQPVNFMKRIICSVFSAYSFESLDQLDYQSLIEVFINAERMMLEANLIHEPYGFLSPEDEMPAKRMPPVPMGPSGPGPMPSNNVKRTATGDIDLDALVKDGKKMERQDGAVPSKAAYNLHDDPVYQARKEAVIDKFSR
jgi:hypothetical protein